MRKFTIAFLRNPTPSLQRHAFFRRDPSPSLLLSTLAPGEYRCEEAASGEAGAWKRNASLEISMGASETRKSIELKADDTDCGSLHAETSAENARPKSTRKAKRKVKAAAQNAATKQAEEEVALLVQADTHDSIVNARRELSECLAKPGLNSKCSRRWEETANMLLDFGISPAHITKMLLKCTALPGTRSPDSTLKHFTMLGMSHEQIGRVISLWPRILGISSNAFQCKVEFFESVGIDRLSLGKFMHKAGSVMALSVSVLRGRCDFWKDYFQDVHVNALRTLILSNPHVLRLDLERLVKPKIAFLEEQGYNKKCLLKKSTILGLSLESITGKSSLLEQFGLSNARSRVMALLDIHSIGTPKLYGRLHNLFALGFCPDQVQKMMLNFPFVLKYNEDHINLRVSYVVNVMNLSLDALVACSAFWGYSLEKRIKYRNEVMQELIARGAYKKKIGLSYMIRMTYSDFSRKFVERLEAYTEDSNICN